MSLGLTTPIKTSSSKATAQDNLELSVLLASYEEAKNLKTLLPALNQELTSLGIRYEILVIDTVEPKDDTPEVCRNNPNVVYFNRTPTNSYGDCVRFGIKQAKGTHILFMDADNSHDPAFISKMFALKDTDLVIASRYVKGGNSHSSAVLTFMSLMVNVIYSFFLQIPIKDISNSFKLYKASQLKKLDLKSENFDVIEEMICKLLNQNRRLSIKEIPLSFKNRSHGKSKRKWGRFILTYIITLFKLLWYRLVK